MHSPSCNCRCIWVRLLKQSALSGLSNANPRLRAPPAPCKEPRVAGRPLMMCFLACQSAITHFLLSPSKPMPHPRQLCYTMAVSRGRPQEPQEETARRRSEHSKRRKRTPKGRQSERIRERNRRSRRGRLTSCIKGMENKRGPKYKKVHWHKFQSSICYDPDESPFGVSPVWRFTLSSMVDILPSHYAALSRI